MALTGALTGAVGLGAVGASGAIDVLPTNLLGAAVGGIAGLVLGGAAGVVVGPAARALASRRSRSK